MVYNRLVEEKMKKIKEKEKESDINSKSLKENEKIPKYKEEHEVSAKVFLDSFDVYMNQYVEDAIIEKNE